MASTVSVFLAFLLMAPVLTGNGLQPFTYTPWYVCALGGSTVNISCIYEYPYKLNHSEVVKSLWFKENQNLPNGLLSDPNYAGRSEFSCGSSDCKLETCKRTCVLTIKDLRQTDSARYKFRPITDQTSTDHYAVAFTVKDLVISRYKNHLNCESACENLNNFIWYKDGEKMSAERKSKYELPQYSQRASYLCAVEGNERSHSTFWCYNHNQCRKVWYNARTICALIGSTVDIHCTHSPSSQSTHKYWYIWRDNQAPSDITQDHDFGRRFQYTDRTRGTLRITGLKVTDSAEYRFTFKTGDFVWSSPLPGTTLTVTGLRVEVTPVATVTEGERVTLTCVTSCPLTRKPSKYNWYHNQSRLKGSQYEKRELSLGRVAPLHAGNYSCSVWWNEANGSPEETLTVQYAPRTPTVSPSGEMEEGSQGQLNCSSDANPAASYTWFKVNTEDSSREMGRGPQLVFSHIEVSHTGQYRCEAQNVVGTTSEQTHVDVKYGPRRTSVGSSPSGDLVEGSSVTLSCSSDSNPAASYSWFRERGDPAGEPGQNYTIANITSNLRGKYYCQAQNAFGRENSTLLSVGVADSSATSWIRAAVIAAVILSISIPLLIYLCPRNMKACRNSSAPTRWPYGKEEDPALTQSVRGPVYDNVLQLTNRGAPPAEREPPDRQDNLHYASIHIFRSKHQEVNPHSSRSGVQSDQGTEVLYSKVNLKRPKTNPEEASRCIAEN